MQVEYNGVSLPFVKTDRYVSMPVWDDGGNYVHTKVEFAGSCLFSPDIPGVTQAGEDFGASLQRIKHALEYPRKHLALKVGEAILCDVPGIDCANGPLPGAFTITRLDGGRAAVCSWSITAHRRDCPDEVSLAPPGYSAHSFTESATIGEDFATVRTRSGKLVTRSDITRDPDAFRYLVTPPLLPGFVRKSSRYTVAADGLSLSYEFQDAESYAIAPPPAIQADGEFKVVTVNAVKMMAEVSVRLVGDPKGSKAALLATAVAVALERIQRANPLQGVLMQGSVSEKLYRNEVTVSLRCQLQAGPAAVSSASSGSSAGGGSLVAVPGFRPGQAPPANQSGTAPVGFATLGFDKKPLYSRDDAQGKPPKSPDPGFRSTAGLRLVAAALQDPCLAATAADTDAVLQGFAGGSPGNTGGSRGTVLSAGPPISPPPTPGAPAMARAPVLAAVEVLPFGADPPDPLRASFDRTIGGGIYAEYTLSARVVREMGRAAVTEQAPGGKTFFPQLCAPSMMLSLDWSASRAGQAPALPPSDPSPPSPPPPPGSPPPAPGIAPNIVLLREEYNPGSIDLADDGVTLVYSLSGRYEYGFVDPALVSPAAVIEPFLWKRIGGLDRPVVFDGPVLRDPATGLLFAGWGAQVAALPAKAAAENPP